MRVELMTVAVALSSGRAAQRLEWGGLHSVCSIWRDEERKGSGKGGRCFTKYSSDGEQRVHEGGDICRSNFVGFNV
jgi:hypothetical protein